MKALSILSLMGVLLVTTACQTKQEYFTKQQFQKKSDSLTAIRFQELEEQAAEDLDRRMAIEIKPKVDSILEKNPVAAPLQIVKEEETVKRILPRDSAAKDSI